MASSFIEQVAVVAPLLQQLAPTSVLDIGKGFGKYGFLLHECVGITEDVTPDPTRKFKDQSTVRVDGVEIQPNYMLPHMEHIYDEIHMGDITEIYPTLTGYDVVLMADVIEHLDKDKGIEVLKHFLADGSAIVVSTPYNFWTQENLYGNPWETHRSLWMPPDFSFAPFLLWQSAGRGRVYLLANTQRRVSRDFGSHPRKGLRRLHAEILALLRDAIPPEPAGSRRAKFIERRLYR
jgi:SAM-dependent methyltransferase